MINTRSHRRLWLWSLLSLLLPLLPVQVCTADAVELKEAQRIARLYSEQGRIIEAERQVNDADARAVTAFARPQLAAHAAWYRLDDNRRLPLLPTTERELSGGIQASQLLFAGGKLWYSHQLRGSLQQLAELNQHSQERALEQNVALAFIDVQRQQQIAVIAKDRLSQRQQELTDAQALFEVGSVAQLDVREARLAVQQALNDLQAVDSSLFVAITEFNRILGRSPQENQLLPSGELSLQADFEPLLQTLAQQIAHRNQLSQQQSQSEVTISQKNYAMATAEHWPQLALVAGAQSRGENRHQQDEAWNVGVELNWQLLSGGAIQAQQAQARAKQQQATARQQHIDKQLLAAWANLQQQNDDLRAQIERQRQSVLLSADNYDDARMLYTEGTITLTHLGQFNLAYAESRFALTQLLYNHNRLYHELRQLVQQRTL